jgi:hypothetical protein
MMPQTPIKIYKRALFALCEKAIESGTSNQSRLAEYLKIIAKESYEDGVTPTIEITQDSFNVLVGC